MLALSMLLLLAGVILLYAALHSPYTSLGTILSGGLDLSGSYKPTKAEAK